jgi:hypothetical protein
MDLRKKNGNIIRSWEEWERPKKAYQWKEGRSAMELARIWFRESDPAPPKEYMEILEKHFERHVKVIKAVPELITDLPPENSRSGRNHDIHCECEFGDQKVTVCVEAKTDESFGNVSISTYYTNMLGQRNDGVSTDLPERVEMLISMLPISCKSVETCPVADNGYQLLTALTGTAIQAKKDDVDFAVLIIHEILTDLTDMKKVDENKADYVSFVQSVAQHQELDCSYGIINGPFDIDGMKCYIGLVETDIRCNSNIR